MLLASRDLLLALPKIKRVNRVRLPAWRSSADGTPAIELLPPGYDDESETYTLVEAEYDEQMPYNRAFELLKSCS